MIVIMRSLSADSGENWSGIPPAVAATYLAIDTKVHNKLESVKKTIQSWKVNGKLMFHDALRCAQRGVKNIAHNERAVYQFVQSQAAESVQLDLARTSNKSWTPIKALIFNHSTRGHSWLVARWKEVAFDADWRFSHR